MNKYRYIVVEDEELICQNIIRKIEGLDLPLQFCGEAEDGEKALVLIDQQNPHIVFTDIKMPVMDGLMLSKELYFAYPQIKIVIISGYDDFEFARLAMKYGASDFLLKPLELDELRTCVLHITALLDASGKILLEDSGMASSMSRQEIADYVEEFIKKNYKENITLNDIADSLGFTPDYISKIFKKEKNITPIKFITKLRINGAKQLLACTGLDILSISQNVGYTDQFYFSRVFKAHTGMYPSEYRNRKEMN